MNQQTFKNLFDVFQKNISEFADKSGGIRDNARIMTQRGLPSTVELSVAYSGFRISFLYHSGRGGGAKSVLSCLFYKTGDMDKLGFLPYDVINEVDQNDFSRYIFSYLYNENQLSTAVTCLCDKIGAKLSDIGELFANDERYAALKQAKKQDINELLGRDAFEQAEALGREQGERFLMRVYDIYYNAVVSRFTSFGYAKLIEGDKPAAKKRYNMFHHLSAYEKRLVDTIDDEQFLMPPEPDCLVNGLAAESASSMLAPYFLLCILSMAVAVPLFYGFYMLIAFVLSRGALYSTAYELYNSMYVFLPAAVVSSLFASSRRKLLPYLCLPKKRELLLRYGGILERPRRRAAKWFAITVVAASVIFTMLIANNGARFYKDRVLINPALTSLRPIEYRYSEIEDVKDGQITFSDGKIYDFSMVGDVEKIEEILK